MTLKEVAHTEVVALDLSVNPIGAAGLASLGAAIGGGGGALASLRLLDLRCCKANALPAELGALQNLSILNLQWCDKLTTMPDLSGLSQLRVTYDESQTNLKAWELGGRKAGCFGCAPAAAPEQAALPATG